MPDTATDVSGSEILGIVVDLVDTDNPDAPEVLDHLIRSRHHDKLSEEKGTDAAESTMGQALIRAQTVKTLGKMGDVVDRAIVLEAIEAEKTGWHHFVPGSEYATVREMLHDQLGEEKSTSVISDITFLASAVVPFAENHKIDGVASLIGRDKRITAKARAIVPRLRMTMAAETDETVKAQAVQKCIELVADKSVSEAAIRAENPDNGKRISNFEVAEYVQPNDESVLVIRVSKRQRAYIQNRLGDKADWHLGDRWPESAQDVD